MLIFWVWCEPFFIESYCSILAWCLNFHSWWSEQTSVPTIYFLQILRCTLTSYIPTHRQDLHSKSKSQTKNIRTTWNSIDPNGYSMGSKSNVQTSWNSSNNTRRCMLWGRRKQEENLRLIGCMLKQSKFDSTYCTNAVLFISINCTKNVFRDTRRTCGGGWERKLEHMRG